MGVRVMYDRTEGIVAAAEYLTRRAKTDIWVIVKYYFDVAKYQRHQREIAKDRRKMDLLRVIGAHYK